MSMLLSYITQKISLQGKFSYSSNISVYKRNRPNGNNASLIHAPAMLLLLGVGN